MAPGSLDAMILRCHNYALDNPASRCFIEI